MADVQSRAGERVREGLNIMRNFALKAYVKYQDRKLRRLHGDEEGVTIVEYGLAAAVISAMLALIAYLLFSSILGTSETIVEGVLPANTVFGDLPAGFTP